jgi:hypothetical protein
LEADSRARHEIMTLTVTALKNRRTQLVGLALRRLPSAKLLELGVSSHTPLDSNALATYTALQECGIPVPGALYPGPTPLLLSFNISCHLGGFRLVQALFENRLCDLNAQLDGITPLAYLSQDPVATGQKESMIQWFLEHGASPIFSSPQMMPNFLFYLASVYDSDAIYQKTPLFSSALEIKFENYESLTVDDMREVHELDAAARDRLTTSSMIELVARFCDPMQRDSCRCSCSSSGCLPLHKFRNGIRLEPPIDGSVPGGWIPKRWVDISDTVRSWMQDCHLNESQAREYLHDACRLEIFTRLGMAHTCCIFEGDYEWGISRFPTRRQRDDGTCRELKDEDAELREQLKAVMEAYDQSLRMYPRPINEFWDWWWSAVQKLLPEIPAEQRRRMYGDYDIKRDGELGGGLTIPPLQRWDYWNIYDDDGAANNAREIEDMDFIDEIKQHFANILSQEPFRGNSAKEHPQDEENATSNDTAPLVSK